MGWRDWAGSAWDNTGGKVWDAIGPVVMYGPDDQFPEDAPINEFLQGISDVPGNIAGGWADAMANQPGWAQVINPLTAGGYVAGEWNEWTSSPTPDFSPQQTALIEQGGRDGADWDRGDLDESGSQIFPNEMYQNEYGVTPYETFTQPEFDPTGVSAPYDTYLSMLEGLYTTPQTGRIQEMLELGQGEARRRMETADAWAATEGARLDASDEALDATLLDMQDKFGERLTTIREGVSERQAATADLREGLIEATAGELGEAGAAFLVSATRTGDVLESQRSRNEQHIADMDGLYSMWSLDRSMQAAGMKRKAREDLADDVLAMKELVHEFDYGIQMANLERLQQAEQFSQGQNRQLAQTLAQIGLQRDLAVQSASSEADDDWERANAWLSNPTTGWAFEGMTPEQVMGMSDAQMEMLYAEAIRSADQIEVAPGVFVDAETAWLNSQQTADPTINVGGAALDLPTTPTEVQNMSQLIVDALANPDVAAVLEGVGTVQGGLGTSEAPVVINTDKGDPWYTQWNWGLW